MSDELDNRLREALRPADPGTQFTDAVMTRIVADGSQRLDHTQPDSQRPSLAAHHARSAPPWRRATTWRWLSGAAAAVVLAVLLVHAEQVRHMNEGLAARQALIQALRVTARSLELAKRAVNDSHEPDSGV